jgi:hypothetical protein
VSDVHHAPAPERSRALLDEFLKTPGVPADFHGADLSGVPSPIVTTAFEREGKKIRLQ